MPIINLGNIKKEKFHGTKLRSVNLTLDYLGNRLLAQGRYSQVEQVLFEENAAKTNMLGYRVLSGEADDLSDLLSSDLSTGCHSRGL